MISRAPISIVFGVVFALVTLLSPSLTTAQVQDGATLTVLRGQVAVIRPDGSAVQPAPSGTVVRTGDELRTISAAGALITFFTGTEIEMGEATILVVTRITRQGERVEVSLKQVFGVTLNRVAALTDPGSSYQIDAGGAVAVVRGTTFAVVGPISTSTGNVVVIVCLEDCDSRSTFAGCPLAPFTGIGVSVDGGRVTSGCESFRSNAAAGYFNAAFEGVTTIEQSMRDGGGRRSQGIVPAGQSREQDRTEQRDEKRERDEDDNDSDDTDKGQARCNDQVTSGGGLTLRQDVELGQRSGTFQFSFQAFSVPDQFEVFYEGNRIFATNGFVSGGNTVTISYGPGSSTKVTVVVTGSSPGTAFTFRVGCPSGGAAPAPQAVPLIRPLLPS